MTRIRATARLRRVRLLVLTAAIWVLLPAAASRAGAVQDFDPCSITTSDRVVAVGDVHGAYDQFTAILREVGLIDRRARWTGGRATLVQTGDVLDRGGESRKVLDLLRRLEGEAARAGGRVHALAGNHEVMRLLGDYRYVSAGEYAAFRTAASEALRDGLYQAAATHQLNQARAAGQEFDEGAFRQRFYDQTPLGLIEMVRSFAAINEYGQWLRSRNAIVRINGIVLLHGGVSPMVAPLGCAGIANATRAELSTLAPGGPQAGATLLTREDGPLWYRGLADGQATPADVDAILDALDARAVVVGHTVTDDHRIGALFGGRVFTIDTGMLAGELYPGGVASALEVEGGRVTAVYRGRREVLVRDLAVRGR